MRTLTKKIKDWVTIVFIAATFVTGVVEFWYKENWVPSHQELSLKVNVEAKRSGSVVNNHLVPVAITFTALNTSGSRKLVLFPSIFYVNGIKIGQADFDILKYYSEHPITKYTTEYSSEDVKYNKKLIAFGGIFNDQGLNPKEEIAKNIIIYVDSTKQDKLEVNAKFIFGNNRKGIQFKFKPTDDEESIDISMILKNQAELKVLMSEELDKLTTEELHKYYQDQEPFEPEMKKLEINTSEGKCECNLTD